MAKAAGELVTEEYLFERGDAQTQVVAVADFGVEVRVKDSTGDYVIIGVGEDRQDAIAHAVAWLEAMTESLQGPPPGV